jgi:hypothetical protein
MFKDLWIAHLRWVFPPLIYSSVDELIRGLDRLIIAPAQARFRELLKDKAEEMPLRRMDRLSGDGKASKKLSRGRATSST